MQINLTPATPSVSAVKPNTVVVTSLQSGSSTVAVSASTSKTSFPPVASAVQAATVVVPVSGQSAPVVNVYSIASLRASAAASSATVSNAGAGNSENITPASVSSPVVSSKEGGAQSVSPQVVSPQNDPIPSSEPSAKNAAERFQALGGAVSSGTENKQPEAKQPQADSTQTVQKQTAPKEATQTEAKGPSPKESASGFSVAELKQISSLSSRDREVRVHEQQHQSVGGDLAGSASFSYQTGPDGIQYAIGGEVPIDISTVPGDPSATIARMQTVRSAALAPADPSSADRSVASAATRIMIQAQNELITQQRTQREASLAKSAETAQNAQDNASSQSSQTSAPGSDLPQKANQVGSAIVKGIQAYNDFINSQKDEGPLTLSQIV